MSESLAARNGVLVVQEQPALLLATETAYVTETATGMTFADDTPMELWAVLTTRLIRQHKKIEWALADAINFGGKRYGETYAQWIEETGLSENTLANIAWVGRKVESSRRREDVDFGYYREVASLSPQDQDKFIEMAASEGLTRFELRQAIKMDREAISITPTGQVSEPVCAADVAWVPDISDLEPDWRPHLEAEARGSDEFIRGALWAWRAAGNEACFRSDRWRD